MGARNWRSWFATSWENAILARFGLDRARTLDDAISVIKRLRSRDLEIVDRPLGNGITGLWFATDGRDQIVVNPDAAFTPDHRGHIIAHELMHILDAVEDPSQERNSAMRTRYDDPVEHRAESLACALMVSIHSAGGVGARLSAMGRYT